MGVDVYKIIYIMYLLMCKWNRKRRGEAEKDTGTKIRYMCVFVYVFYIYTYVCVNLRNSKFEL